MAGPVAGSVAGPMTEVEALGSRRGRRAGRLDPPPYEAGLSTAQAPEEPERRGRGGFALGFLGTLAVAALLAAGYLYAEAVSAAAPALAEPMAAYVEAVTEARVAVNAAARAAAVRLNGLLPDPASGG